MTQQPPSPALFSGPDEQLGDDTSQKHLVQGFSPVRRGDAVTPDCRQRVLMQSASERAKRFPALCAGLCTKGRASANGRHAAASGQLLQAGP